MQDDIPPKHACGHETVTQASSQHGRSTQRRHHNLEIKYYHQDVQTDEIIGASTRIPVTISQH